MSLDSPPIHARAVGGNSIVQTILACFRAASPAPSDRLTFNQGELVIPASPTIRFDPAVNLGQAVSGVADGTLIVPCLNERASLESWFRSLRLQRVLTREILIVDGGSSDGTIEVLNNLLATEPLEGVAIRVICLPGSSIAEARNHAAKQASAELLLFTDFGCVLHPDWIRLLTAAAIANPDRDWILGGYTVDTPSRLSRLLSELTTPNLLAISGEQFLPSARSMAIRRPAFNAVGGFPEFLTKAAEDTLLDAKLRCRGTTAVFIPEARVSWQLSAGAPELFPKFYSYAKGDGETGVLFVRHYRWLVRRVSLIALGLLIFASGLVFQQTAIVALGVLVGVLSLRELLLPYGHFLRHFPRRREPVARLFAVLLLVVAQTAGFISGSRDARRQGLCRSYLRIS